MIQIIKCQELASIRAITGIQLSSCHRGYENLKHPTDDDLVLEYRNPGANLNGKSNFSALQCADRRPRNTPSSCIMSTRFPSLMARTLAGCEKGAHDFEMVQIFFSCL